MSAEMRNASSYLKEMAERAREGGYSEQAAQIDEQAQVFEREARKIEELNGPEYFLEPSEELESQAPETPGKMETPVVTPQDQLVPNFYIRRPVEGLVLPSKDQLVVAAHAELKASFGRDFEVPNPPDELFETLEGFAERGITRFDETYYFPELQLEKGDTFWKARGRVAPEPYFWQQIKDGNFPADVARLEEGWYIGDRRGKPMYANGKQRYGEDDYMEPLMAHLRAADRIQKYSRVPDTSRFGASPLEIEGVILPTFAEMSGAKGIIRNRRYIESNVIGNMRHPEIGKTTTLEWYGDPVFQGDYRLIGGRSGDGGLADVNDYSAGSRNDIFGFSPVVAFPSKPR